LALFVFFIIAFVALQTSIIKNLSAEIENSLHELRVELIKKTSIADFEKIENLGKASLYENINKNVQIISENSQFLSQAMISLVLIVTILIYISTISIIAFVLLTGVLLIASLLYWNIYKKADQLQANVADKEDEAFEIVDDLFSGFKEQKMSGVRSLALSQALESSSKGVMIEKARANMQAWSGFILGETAFNIMLGVIIFLTPLYSTQVEGSLAPIAAAIMFLSVPVFSLMQSISILRTSENATRRMLDLNQTLSELAEDINFQQSEFTDLAVKNFGMSNISFRFTNKDDEPPFSMGPLNVTFNIGDITFITGGNGAGKSTFINVLLGLLHPQSGNLFVNDIKIDRTNILGYRSLFSPIFSDFHLFKKLYGIECRADEKVADLLRWMELENVISFNRDRFSSQKLSTGQRKRLALIRALLANRKILIFDEWAADQDAQFRKKFYTEILPKLKIDGYTIIAVTHDDQYFSVADKCLQLAYGELIEV
jgi:putative ATP-binding cassette transporter